MNSKLNQYLVVLAAGGVILANTTLGFANQTEMRSFSLSTATEADFESVEPVEPAARPPAQPAAQPPVRPAVAPNEALVPVAGPTEQAQPEPPHEDFLRRVKQELNLSKADYRQVLNGISDTKKRLENVTEEKLTLQQQLRNLDDQIALSTEKLLSVIKQIIQKENEITLLYEQIEIREVALEYQKSLLRDYIRIIYQEENAFLTVEEGEINAFKLLLTDGSVSDNLRKLEYFDLLNEAGQQLVDKLDRLFKELDGQRLALSKGKAKLDQLRANLSQEKEQLELQKEAKQELYRITLGQEEIYTQLLEQTLEEQAQLINDIKNLGNAMAFIERKITEEGNDFDPEKYRSLLDYKTQAFYDFQIDSLGLESRGFVWPVEPDLGISAYFRDPRYAGSFGVQHNAIDIPEYQGSPVRAAGDGVVYTARDNGYGYSYIILAHAGGLMTVYGHLSSILVEEGQTVAGGSFIGLSGGMPGTRGAGYMTTGPHLHFEVLLNGLYVDPLEYLPLDVFTEEQILELPEKYHDDWEDAVLVVGL